MTYVSEMTEGQTLCHAGSCDKAEDCRSGIGMTPDRHLPVTSTPELCEKRGARDWKPLQREKNHPPAEDHFRTLSNENQVQLQRKSKFLLQVSSNNPIETLFHRLRLYRGNLLYTPPILYSLSKYGVNLLTFKRSLIEPRCKRTVPLVNTWVISYGPSCGSSVFDR